jgi:hypothetical protein
MRNGQQQRPQRAAADSFLSFVPQWAMPALQSEFIKSAALQSFELFSRFGRDGEKTNYVRSAQSNTTPGRESMNE